LVVTSTWKASAAYVDAQLATMRRYGSLPKRWNRRRRRELIEKIERIAQQTLRQQRNNEEVSDARDPRRPHPSRVVSRGTDPARLLPGGGIESLQTGRPGNRAAPRLARRQQMKFQL
jgi:hypothetical protein